jgi:response regulator of citrate/malate metabolism
MDKKNMEKTDQEPKERSPPGVIMEKILQIMEQNQTKKLSPTVIARKAGISPASVIKYVPIIIANQNGVKLSFEKFEQRYIVEVIKLEP